MAAPCPGIRTRHSLPLPPGARPTPGGGDSVRAAEHALRVRRAQEGVTPGRRPSPRLGLGPAGKIQGSDQLTSDPSRKSISFSGFEACGVEAGCYLSITHQELRAPLPELDPVGADTPLLGLFLTPSSSPPLPHPSSLRALEPRTPAHWLLRLPGDPHFIGSWARGIHLGSRTPLLSPPPRPQARPSLPPAPSLPQLHAWWVWRLHPRCWCRACVLNLGRGRDGIQGAPELG